MLLDHLIMHTYSQAIQAGLEEHPTRVIDRCNITAIKPPIISECIRIRWTGRGVVVWSNRRCFATEVTTKVTGSKERRVPCTIKANTIGSYFQPLQPRFPKKRQREVECRTSNKKEMSKIDCTSDGGALS